MPRGRPKGSLSAKTREVAEKAAKQGITPLEVMLKAMRSAVKKLAEGKDTLSEEEKEGYERRALEAAQMAAPYMHPKLQAIESKVEAKVEQTVVSAKPLNEDEWAQMYAKATEAPVEPVEQPNVH